MPPTAKPRVDCTAGSIVPVAATVWRMVPLLAATTVGVAAAASVGAGRCPGPGASDGDQQGRHAGDQPPSAPREPQAHAPPPSARTGRRQVSAPRLAAVPVTTMRRTCQGPVVCPAAHHGRAARPAVHERRANRRPVVPGSLACGGERVACAVPEPVPVPAGDRRPARRAGRGGGQDVAAAPRRPRRPQHAAVVPRPALRHARPDHRPPRRRRHAHGRAPDPPVRPRPRAGGAARRRGGGPAPSAPRRSSCARSAASPPASSPIGMATWTVPGASRPPAAPVLLRSCVLQGRPARRSEDFDLDLGADVELNPVLRALPALRAGPRDRRRRARRPRRAWARASTRYPMYRRAEPRCARGVPDFSITPRLVVGTFSYAKLPMVADLAAQGDTLADHDVVAALAGDPDALRGGAAAAVPDAPRRPRARPRAPRPRRRLLPAGRHRRGPRGRPPGHQGPARHRQEPDHRQPHRLARPARASGCCSSPRSAPPSTPCVGRLDRLGLGDLVLDAYDGATNRRRLAQELGAALERGQRRRGPRHHRGRARRCVDRRTRLTEHADGPARACASLGRVSAYDAQEALARLSPAPHAADLPGAPPRRGAAGGVAATGSASSAGELHRGRVAGRLDAPTAATTPGTAPASPPRTRRRRRSTSPAG